MRTKQRLRIEAHRLRSERVVFPGMQASMRPSLRYSQRFFP